MAEVNHSHDWVPLENAVAQYTCACGMTGRRGLNGRIRETAAVASFDLDDLVTARLAPVDEIEDCTGRRRRLNPDNWRDDGGEGEFDAWGANL